MLWVLHYLKGLTMYKINQRVNTIKYGAGMVKGFERLTDKVQQTETYQNGDRIAVQLDTPENWPLHAHGLPYFMPGDFE